MELEIAAAETAQHKPKEKAANELREARRRKHQDEVDAKIND